MSGDIAFEHELQRTISVDVRYILFVIDKFAGAGHIIDELSLVSTPKAVKKLPTYTEVWNSNIGGITEIYKTKADFVVAAKAWWMEQKN